VSSDVFAEIIADFRQWPIPRPTPREVELPSLPGKVDAVVGMRRSGKTWFLFQQIQDLLGEGIARERILYVNFEDERLLPLEASDLTRIPGALYARYPHVVDQECWLFLDEIQNVEGWERFVRRMVDTTRFRCVVTGSSSRLLSQEIATALRGRALPTEILPFGFREHLRHAGLTVPGRWPPSERERAVLRHQFDVYLHQGGFPEVQGLPDELRVRVLRDYVDVVLLRDVIERHGVSNTTALRWIVRRLLRSPGSLFSAHRLHNELRSQGLRLGKDGLHEILGCLKEVFLLFFVPIHSASVKRQMVNPRKCYLVDTALAGTVSFLGGRDVGHLLENAVYLELRRRGYECRYVVTRSGHEVDFLAVPPSGLPRLVQVCAHPEAPHTRERELRAAREAAEELGIHDLTVVTLDTWDTLRDGATTIHLVPAWSWFARRPW